MIICITILSFAMTGASPSNEIDPLIKFTEVAEEDQLEINSWEVLIKETKQIKNREAYVNKFRNQQLITMTKDENSINYIFEERNNNAIQINYQLVLPLHSDEQAELIIAISGNEWNEKIKENYTKIAADLKKEKFTSKAKTFACIEFIEGGTIGDRMIIDSFLSSLEVVHMKVQNDTVQSSRLKNVIYGYTPLWKESFDLEGIPLNLQIAVTELETGDLKYTIGTPILINEY